MNRLNLLLGALLLIQVLLLVVVVRPFHAGEAAVTDRVALLEDLRPDDVLEVRITDADGKTVDIEKSGGAWVLGDAGGYPVKAEKVTSLLDDLLALQGGRPVTRQAKNFAKLEVSETKFERKVELLGDGARPLATLYVGTSPNYNLHNVRREGRDAVYAVAGVSPWELATTRGPWVETQWLEIEPDEVTSLSLRHGDASFEIARGEDGGWRMTVPEEVPVAKEKADSVVRGFASLYLTEPVGKGDDAAYGFDQPTAEVTLVVEHKVAETSGDQGEGEAQAESEPKAGEDEVAKTEAETIRIVIGKKRGEEPADYYAKRSGSDFVVTLSSYTVESKFLRKLEDFVPKPEEEAPEGEGTAAPAENTGEADPGGEAPESPEESGEGGEGG